MVTTVRDLGWLGIKNGALLTLADEKFDVLLTADQSMPHQQRLAKRRIGIRILPTNEWGVIRNHLRKIEDALDSVQPGTCERIEF
jgi:hypothetical protein